MVGWPMPNEDLAPLRRFWWLPLLVFMLLQVVWPLCIWTLWAAIDGPHKVLFLAVRWAPTALLLGADLAWLTVFWPKLKSGGVYQTLLGLQAAMPLAWGFLWLSGLGRWAAAHAMSPAFYPLLLLPVPLMEIALLAGALSLRRREPAEAPAAVMASAGLVMMNGGWIGVGLGSVLAWIWKDPFPSDLCGEGGAARRRAAFISFAFPVAAFVQAALPLFQKQDAISGFLRALWMVPPLYLGGLAWDRMAARMDARGRAKSVWIWILAALGLLLMFGVMVALAAFLAYSYRGPW